LASSSFFADNLVVYRTQMHADMRTKQVQPVVFGCTAAFDEKVSSVDVYRTTAMPLVQQAVEGGVATLLMFGQTGSGKTYTMTAMEELLAADVFTFDPNTTTNTASATGKLKVEVCVQYLELCGKICRDLLDDSRAEVRIVDNNDEDGSVCFVNATSVVVETAEELVNVMAEAKQRRATQATEKNDESSRSHAVCQMTINANFEEESQSPAAWQRGILTLVDCAGTERRNDSMYHSRSRQAESNEINASLYALKECIRARSSSNSSRYVPYRSNILTRVLRESLERRDARLAVIATVAPNATDTEHTIQTLKTVSTLIGSSSEEGPLQKVSPSSCKFEEHPIAPKKWDHQALVEWLSEKKLLGKPVPGHVDGRLTMKMSKILLRNTFYEDDGMDKAEVLFRCLRSETDRVDRLDWKRRIATKTK
jgi:kinesin family protein 2/24